MEDIVANIPSGEHDRERLIKAAEILEDIRVAEEQIARGEGVEHDEAKHRILARLRR
jgi:hypothetical protein